MQALSQLSYTPLHLSVPVAELKFCVRNLAEWTGLEPATPGVTGRYSNQLNYHSWQETFALPTLTSATQVPQTWRPYGDSNPGTYRERVVS